MKKFPILSLIVVFFILFANCLNGQIPEGSLPASTNIRADQCPCILPDLSVIFRIHAPDATKVQLDLGRLYEMKQDENGIWTVKTDPQVPGFHYYSLVIGGLKFADPASESFYGMGRMASGIDIPEAGVDFYTVKDVPHGEIRSVTYFSYTTNSWRKLNIYTPPGYDRDVETSYPVMYLQHGGGEDERGWAVQGKTDVVMDNLIAEGKAKPMIVVMANGNATQVKGLGGYTDEAMAIFKEEMIGNIVPFVEKHYRVIANVESRALAGLSMGGGQSFYTGLRNTNVFSHVGIFSSGIFGGIANPQGKQFDAEAAIPGILTNSSAFNKSLKALYISVGEQDPRFEHTKKAVQTFRDNGLNVQFNSFPGDHEWQVWRKSLHDFAQRIFK
ncbi:MAG: esterase [Bacteroidales bacterium]|nr:esterase [Bacteroidales bacterium]